MRWHEVISKFFGIIFLLALVLGFLLPGVFLPLSGITMYVLGVIITLSFLTLDYGEFFKTIKQFYIPLAVFVIYKLLLPAGLYFLFSLWQRNIGLAVLLLAATPVGMITPALAQITGGDRSFVLALVIITAFTAPFYLPLLLQLVGGAYIELNALSMMFSLSTLIFIPFAVSLVLRRFVSGFIKKTAPAHGALSVMLLVFVLLGIAAQGSAYIRENPAVSLSFLGASFVLAAVLAVLGYFGFRFLGRERRLGLTVAVTYMNLALAITLAAKYFTPDVMLFCIMYEVPGNLLPVVLRRLGRGKRKQML